MERDEMQLGQDEPEQDKATEPSNGQVFEFGERIGDPAESHLEEAGFMHAGNDAGTEGASAAPEAMSGTEDFFPGPGGW